MKNEYDFITSSIWNNKKIKIGDQISLYTKRPKMGLN